MTTYYRIQDGALLELAPEQYALLQANGKAAWLRLYSVDPVPVPSSTQYVITGPYVIDATTARKTWTLVDKDQAQVDAEVLAAAQKDALTLLKQAITAIQNDIQAGVTSPAGTLAAAIADIQDLKRRALRVDRVILWLLRNS